jgi:hypothetical protein
VAVACIRKDKEETLRQPLVASLWEETGRDSEPDCADPQPSCDATARGSDCWPLQHIIRYGAAAALLACERCIAAWKWVAFAKKDERAEWYWSALQQFEDYLSKRGLVSRLMTPFIGAGTLLHVEILSMHM